MSIYATLAFNLKNVFGAVNKTAVMVTLEYIWFRYLFFSLAYGKQMQSHQLAWYGTQCVSRKDVLRVNWRRL